MCIISTSGLRFAGERIIGLPGLRTNHKHRNYLVPQSPPRTCSGLAKDMQIQAASSASGLTLQQDHDQQHEQEKIQGKNDRTEQIPIIYMPYSGWTKHLKDQRFQSSFVSHPTLIVERPYSHRIPLCLWPRRGDHSRDEEQCRNSISAGFSARVSDLVWAQRRRRLGSSFDCDSSPPNSPERSHDWQSTSQRIGRFPKCPLLRMHFYCSAMGGHATWAVGPRIESGPTPAERIISRAAAEAIESVGNVDVLV
ncbi:hypothetical protein BJY01DRAFT_47401 [Aspergillus pseudoustus]|uniref:Uncharacterized protein n=1 Tax=Aspergillus pseudoustus TaxID=1810923 RepID=A0ABR4JAZ8_9EURO